MRKITALFFLFLTFAVFLFQDVNLLLAGDTASISCGDYNIITRKVGDDEQLFRINAKTGETWRYEKPDIGWVKVREQS
jgi:hypothetical protein